MKLRQGHTKPLHSLPKITSGILGSGTLFLLYFLCEIFIGSKNV